jgi:xanthine/CO dehydrogenase XdhC/CoxF family maturation factor
LEILLERLQATPVAENLFIQVGRELQQRRSCQIQTRYGGGDDLGTRLLLSENPAEVVPGIFREIVLPPVRLVVFGTGPEVDPLRDFTRNLGWICENYPQLTDLPPESLPDRRTAAVIMNHHFGRDLAALQVILPQDYAYVGVLGPKKRWQELVHHLQAELTFDSLWQNKVYGPVGLDLGAETPEEIALSIVAEVQAVMTGREGGFLRNRQKPIHNRS